MCREVEKLAMEERLQGQAEGMAKGLAEGMEKGLAKGMEKGRSEGIITSIRALMKGQSISADDAMQMLQVPEEDKETYRRLLNQ